MLGGTTQPPPLPGRNRAIRPRCGQEAHAGPLLPGFCGWVGGRFSPSLTYRAVLSGRNRVIQARRVSVARTWSGLPGLCCGLGTVPRLACCRPSHTNRVIRALCVGMARTWPGLPGLCSGPGEGSPARPAAAPSRTNRVIQVFCVRIARAGPDLSGFCGRGDGRTVLPHPPGCPLRQKPGDSGPLRGYGAHVVWFARFVQRTWGGFLGSPRCRPSRTNRVTQALCAGIARTCAGLPGLCGGEVRGRR